MSRIIAGCLALQVFALSCVDHDHDSLSRGRRKAADAAVDASSDAASDDADGDVRDAAATPAAGPDASTEQRELNARLTELLRQIEREARMRCPCLVATGGYPSEDECRQAVSFKTGWEACVEYVPIEADLDEPLQCALTELQRRNDCLEPAACDSKMLGICRAGTIDCPKLGSELLVRVVQYCPRYVMLFH